MKILCNGISRITGWLLFLLTFLALHTDSSAQTPREDPVYLKGETIFKANCTSCHKINGKLVGPALAGVYDKYDTEWLYSWIKNSQAMVKAGDPDAVKIFNEYNGSVMTAFNLSNEEIDAVLQYIKVETEIPPPGEVVVPGEGTAVAKGSSQMAIFLAIIASILVAILFILSRITGTLGELVREKMGLLVPEKWSFGETLKSKKVITLASLALIIFVGYKTVDNAQRLGRQQNYQPAQPIKFSHELHAGVNEIECQYCHSGAAKGKSAVIPSANVCMNCHKAIPEGPKHGTTEIAKIYDAIGWDPENQEYIEGYEQKPIEWIRIHNLPDHVYFNHAQHVNAGQLDCQTCHGPIEEMEEVYQYSTLGMGWCINCHRNTSVNFQGNDYYQIYEKYHEQMKSGEIKQVTVEDIGGLECQKCHY
ncbi:MAG: c-type cytochrome [Chitinophagales bacterium]